MQSSRFQCSNIKTWKNNINWKNKKKKNKKRKK